MKSSVTWKKSNPKRYVSTVEVLDELLCFGWVDGARCKLDDERTMQLISPRKTQHWTRTYKDRAARLEKEGKMHASGRAAIASAKRSGLWKFMDDVDALQDPKDLTEALAATPPAQSNGLAASPSYRRNVLRWIKLAETGATRKRRIEKVRAFSEANERISQM